MVSFIDDEHEKWRDFVRKLRSIGISSWVINMEFMILESPVEVKVYKQGPLGLIAENICFLPTGANSFYTMLVRARCSRDSDKRI